MVFGCVSGLGFGAGVLRVLAYGEKVPTCG